MDLPLPTSIVALPRVRLPAPHLPARLRAHPTRSLRRGQPSARCRHPLYYLRPIFFLLFACSRSSAPFVVRLFLNLIMAMAAAAMLAVACLGIAVGFHIPF
eukprot:gnl/Ergobibamus_cyprinoides/5526.p2 GENE.gnl/Ergobibamus_cyprinoides/5526~~gnl/Ergobibamus_cyprinoides/5526.p2  ORF type:complete len:110 (+),score=13.46 gnl/Ergobibamus_cyprinoides/5526:30-332(+)